MSMFAALDDGSASGLDLSKVSANLDRVHAVEQGWSLPALPDTVKLDLATHFGDQTALHETLNTIDRKLSPDSQPPAPPVDIGYTQPARTTFDTLRATFAGVTQQPEPKDLSADSVEAWKAEAVRKGYGGAGGADLLNDEGVVDGKWDPAFNSIRHQMMFDDMADRFAGDRPGAVRSDSALEMIGKWTSPSGLMRAATQLDLWWDPKQIGKEFSTWGDKWHKVGQSKNPLEFGKNLLDAATGPVDDIVVPALNWALLLTGVGEAYNFARLGLWAEKGLVGAEAIGGLYEAGSKLGSVGKFVKSADYALDAEKMAEASFISGKIGHWGSVGEKVSSQMNAWREMKTIRLAKKITQQGMRLGAVQMAEQGLGFGGTTLGLQDSLGNALDSGVNSLNSSPVSAIAFGIGEAALTPYTVFERGSIKSLAQAAGKLAPVAIGAGAGAVVGDDQGGTAGAVAGGLVGGAFGIAAEKTFAKVMSQREAFRTVANSSLTRVFHDAATVHLTGDDLATYQKTFAEKGARAALAEAYTGIPDAAKADEMLGAAMTHASISAAIDHTASVQANIGDADNALFNYRYRTVRNKLTAQLRVLDGPIDEIRPDVLRTLALKEGSTNNNLAKDMAALDLRLSNDDLIGIVDQHNRMAQSTLERLLSPENLPVEAADSGADLFGPWASKSPEARQTLMSTYLRKSQVMDTFGNFPQFITHETEIQGLDRMGILKGIEGVEVKSPMTGRLIGMPETDFGKLIDDPDIFSRLSNYTKEGKTSLLAKPAPSELGRFTVMKADTLTKQHYIAAAREVEDRVKLFDQLKQVERKWTRSTAENIPTAWARIAAESGTLAESLPANLSQLDQAHIDALLAVHGQLDGSGDLGRVLRYMKKANVVPADVRSHMLETLDQLESSSKWVDEFAMHPLERKGAGDHVIVSNLKERSKGLRKRASYTAQEIDTDKHLSTLAEQFGVGSDEHTRFKAMTEGLKGDGYKLVHGADFLMPQELALGSGMFTDITERHLKNVTAGVGFFHRAEGDVLALKRAQKQREEIAKALSSVGHDVSKGDVVKMIDPDHQTVSSIIKDLKSVIGEAQDGALKSLDDLDNKGFMSRRFHTAARGLATANTPASMSDLANVSNRKRVLEALAPIYGEETAKAVWRGLKEASKRSFNEVGLYSLENHMRANNQLAGALSVFSGSKWSEGITNPVLKAATSAAPGAVIGGLVGQDGTDGALKGAAIGGAVGLLASKPLSSLGRSVQASNYGYLADSTAHVRDFLRFTINPQFDISRFTEAMMLANTAVLPKTEAGVRATLRFNQSPSALVRSIAKDFVKAGEDATTAKVFAKAKFEESRALYRSMSGGVHDVDAGESSIRYFNAIGMAGFDPMAWQASTFHQLVEQGVETKKAWETVREMHTYGLKARSAAEMSTNMVLFPFSFQKKMVQHVGRFLAEDISRAVVVHDGLRMYDALNERYDLSTWFREHMPALKELQKLNTFSYGLSPGRVGGINRNIAEAGLETIRDVLFTPQGYDLRTASEHDELQKKWKKLVPAINDAKYLWDDLQQQGSVLTSTSHVTSRAQAEKGYAAWNEVRNTATKAAVVGGGTLADVNRAKPGSKFYAVRQYMEAEKARLGEEFPGWVESKTNSLVKNASNSAEKQMAMVNGAVDPQTGRPQNPTATLGEIQFAGFDAKVTALREAFKKQSKGGVSAIDDLPPEAFNAIREEAVRLVGQNPKFQRIYSQFYERDFGPIERKI
jgi:hypothetical protein